MELKGLDILLDILASSSTDCETFVMAVEAVCALARLVDVKVYTHFNTTEDGEIYLVCLFVLILYIFSPV